MRNQRGLNLFDVIVIILVCLVLAALLIPLFEPVRDEMCSVRCSSHLAQLAKAMNLYLNKYGNELMYSIPAESFRGDSWLATLYWTHIITEPKVFLCPRTDDHGFLPSKRPRNLASADAVAPDAVSYAGLCNGLRFPLAHRNTRSFAEGAINSSCILACDDNEGTQNHPDGICVVYFDSHVEFQPGTKVETYDLIGAKGGPYEYLDSGE